MSSSNTPKNDATTQQKGRNHLQTVGKCQIVLETRHRNFEAPIFVFHFAVPTPTLH